MSLEILCRITPDLAKELIQPIGDRIVFLEKIAQIKAVECTDKVQLAQVCLNYIYITLNNYNDGILMILQEKVHHFRLHCMSFLFFR